MKRLLSAFLNDASREVKGRIIRLYGFLLLFNIGAWVWALIEFRDYPLLLGTALLAYGFGLRHAVDADHIAAIDNVTRKLMQEGKQPVTVGFLFSLGHSSIVVIASLAIAATALVLKQDMGVMHAVGGVVGTLVSSFFLLVIALLNFLVLRSVCRAFRRVREGHPYVEEDFDLLLADRGLLARLFRPLFRLISHSWHMYPLGVLFGLGFDTASEIGLLGISAAEASKGLSVWSIMVFPILFTAGMALIDTTDSVLMLGAYGWAFVKPIRKLYYNMTITLVSVVVALLVGGIEVLGLVADRFQLSGTFWDDVAALGDHFGLIGYGIIAVFVVSWLLAFAYYKWRGYDAIELRP